MDSHSHFFTFRSTTEPKPDGRGQRAGPGLPDPGLDPLHVLRDGGPVPVLQPAS